MGDVKAVPAGKYAKAALEKLGVWASVEGSLAQAENVRAALKLVATGEAPAGIVYETDAREDKQVKVLGTFPADTHPKIVWYRDEAEWRQVSKANTAVHAVFPAWVQRTFHFIQEHTAHHLRPSIPIYHLAEAQACLEEKEDVDVVVYEWSAARHADIARRCKLYDFEAKRWMDFDGRYTSPPPSRKRVATPNSPDVLAAAEAS